MSDNNKNDMQNIYDAIRNGNVEALYQNMLDTNQSFRDFVLENKNLTAKQIADKYGIRIDS